MQPRTLEVFHFLGLSETHNVATAFPPIQEYAKGSLKPLNTFPFYPYYEPTPAIPYVRLSVAWFLRTSTNLCS